MIRDLLEITIIEWAITAIAKLIKGAYNAVTGSLKFMAGGIYNLLTPPKNGEGKVRRVIDGDSLEVETPEGLKEVRIKGIDAPEFGQEGFGEAKRATERLTLGQKIALIDQEMDNFGRTTAEVVVGHSQKNTAEELAAQGLAFPDPKETTKEIKKAANVAKNKSLGVWQKGTIPPWDFRDMN